MWYNERGIISVEYYILTWINITCLSETKKSTNGDRSRLEIKQLKLFLDYEIAITRLCELNVMLYFILQLIWFFATVAKMNNENEMDINCVSS